MKFKVIEKVIKTYEIEVEAESETEAIDKAQDSEPEAWKVSHEDIVENDVEEL